MTCRNFIKSFLPAFFLMTSFSCASLCLSAADLEEQAQALTEKEEFVSNQENRDDTIVVGYSQIGAESDWRIANTESVRGALTAENGFYLIYENAQQMQEKQVKALRNFILQGVDYIVLNPIIETGWDSTLQEAKDKGIPVIIVDRKVEVEDESLYTCWIGSDFKKEGSDAGEWLADYLKEAGRDDQEVNIVLLQGTEGSSAQIGRTAGFSEVALQHENWHVIYSEDADFTQAKGKEVMSSILKDNSNIDILVSENDNMTFGAIEAIREAGLTCGVDGDITVISFDAVSSAFDEMIAGNINADFECNPLHGPIIRDAILALERGEEVGKTQYMQETYFDTSMDLESLKAERTY